MDSLTSLEFWVKNLGPTGVILFFLYWTLSGAGKVAWPYISRFLNANIKLLEVAATYMPIIHEDIQQLKEHAGLGRSPAPKDYSDESK